MTLLGKMDFDVGCASAKLFPGQYYDSETELHYNYFRDYDPSTGRYVQSDPIGLDGGLNTYGYVGGDPLGYVDPYGLSHLRWLLNPKQSPFPATTPAGDHITYSNPIQDINDVLTKAAASTLMGIAKMCMNNDAEKKKKKGCQALKDSILATCASLSGKKMFACFQAAQDSYDQCMSED